MDKQNLFPACPVETTLKLIGDKWNVLILRDLFLGTKRFSELKRSLAGVSQKVLTSQLRGMEEAGLVSRAVYPEVPPRVEYSLTARPFAAAGDRVDVELGPRLQRGSGAGRRGDPRAYARSRRVARIKE
ncbi:winged helix-turn-helix transcriptional regulator [Pyramidobacter piscolens]|uniref:winged helix-turn-helix transcriptional regulator n=1 Tax=Pyramidobacter piscolens TaxID=638849 RepID=UPI0026670E2A|nr:helix-turn-helix domain-containing protein [Pyramidobacter piscolens]